MRTTKLPAIAVAAVLLASLALLPVAMEGDAGVRGKRTVTCAVFHDGKREMVTEELSLLRAGRLLVRARAAVDAWKTVQDEDVSAADSNKIRDTLTSLFAALENSGLLPEGIKPGALGLLPEGGIAWMHPIVSCGSGFGLIPLYPGEAFLGVMLRPMFLQYFLLGYTGCLNARLIPPRVEYWDFTGTQTVMVFGFAGLYLDFASLGLGIPPVQVLMGESLFTGGIDWPA
ncbi:MAG: hypothetical protein KGY55_04525 [Candidatus Thermoplasmatota archaeon]|nr:hypothetical protein [Candidatus Thermoplasmatota archaeon]